MTGPQGMGPLIPGGGIPGFPGGITDSPIEFVYAYSSTTRDNIPMPAGMHWLPGDYVFVTWWDYTGGQSITSLPSWMNRLDGLSLSSNPAFFGGRIPDFYALDQSSSAFVWNLGTGLSDQSNAIFTIAVYRNVDNDLPVDSYARETLHNSPGTNDVIGPVTVPVGGSAILMGNVSVGTGFPSIFLFQSPAVERLSAELSAGRATRVFDKLNNAASLDFQTVDTSGFAALSNLNNYFWEIAANAEPAPYDPPYSAISTVGTVQNGQVTSGTTITPNLPSGIADGDLVIIALHNHANESTPFTIPTGWKQVRIGISGRTVCVYVKRGTAGMTAPTFTAPNAGTVKQYVSIVYRNVGAFNWCQQGANDTPTLTPAVTTTVDGTVAVAFATSDFYQPVSMATANGYTQQGVQNDASHGGVIISDKTFSGVGTTINYPTFQATTSSDFMSCGLFTLIPGDMVFPIAPTVTIDKAVGQADPATGSSILFDIVFSERVSGFTAGDVTLTGSGSAGTTATVVSLYGSGRHFRATVTGMSVAGDVTASISANAAQSVDTGTNSAGSTSTDNTVAWS